VIHVIELETSIVGSSNQLHRMKSGLTLSSVSKIDRGEVSEN